jgi:1-acyl-sn-glycerol-3-phosphate acyltransferase
MQELIPTKYSWLPKWLMPLDFLGLLETDPFGNPLIVKRLAIFVLGWITYWRLTVLNRIRIEGTEYLENLPDCNVLFLSNHQTYFADVMAIYQIFCSLKWGFKNTIVPPLYLLSPRARSYYVAAGETMQAGIIPRIFSLAGAITVDRSWRADGHNTKRGLDTSAGDKIGIALKHGWIVSFPQGTTSPYAPIRKGTGYLVKEHNPIVVPVVINGFRRAFDKKGLVLKKRNTILSVKFKEPIRFDKNCTVDEIVDRVRKEIGQEIPYDKMTWMKDENRDKDKKNGY